jgi:hypothetical protein
LPASCGKYDDLEPQKQDSLGVVRNLEPLSVSSKDVWVVNAICQALREKTNNLNAYIGRSYTFSYSHKPCEATEFSGTKEIPVILNNMNERYYFQPEGNGTFPFQDVETIDSGSMVKLCEAGSQLSKPYVNARRDKAVWFYTEDISNCRGDADHVCILIERASVQNESKFKVDSTEVIKFNIKQRDPLTGFFVERFYRSSLGCDGDKRLERKVFLK